MGGAIVNISQSNFSQNPVNRCTTQVFNNYANMSDLNGAGQCSGLCAGTQPTTYAPQIKNAGVKIYLPFTKLRMRDPETLLEFAYFADPVAFKQAFMSVGKSGIAIDDTHGYDSLKKQFGVLAYLHAAGQDKAGRVKNSDGSPIYFSVNSILSSLKINHKNLRNSLIRVDATK